MSKQGDLKVSLDTMQAEEQLDGLAEQIRGLGESIQDVEKKKALGMIRSMAETLQSAQTAITQTMAVVDKLGDGFTEATGQEVEQLTGKFRQQKQAAEEATAAYQNYKKRQAKKAPALTIQRGKREGSGHSAPFGFIEVKTARNRARKIGINDILAVELDFFDGQAD